MRLLGYKQAGELLGGMSESTIRRLVKAGTLPAPIVVSTKRDGTPARCAFVGEEFEAAVEKLVGGAQRVTWAPNTEAPSKAA